MLFYVIFMSYKNLKRGLSFVIMMQPKVVCTFPLGQLKAEEVELDEERAIALSGFLGGPLLNGQAVASYSDESATLKYTFKVPGASCHASLSYLYFLSV